MAACDQGSLDQQYLTLLGDIVAGGPDSVWEERIDLLKPYQVNAKAMELTGNPNAKFLHCLPAFHNAKTEVGKEMAGKGAVKTR